MRQTMTPLLVLLLCACAASLAGGAVPIQGGGESAEASAVNSVMRFRRYTVQDSTRFDACRVFSVLGEPADFPAGIHEQLVPLLHATSDPCRPESRPHTQRWPEAVLLDSVSLDAGGGRVFTTVYKGENTYHEVYTLGAPPERAVQEVRLWGFEREYRVRRP